MTYAGRLENASGETSLEELVAALPAACYAMALSNVLAENDTPPERLTVDAGYTLDNEHFKLTTMDLNARGAVTGVSDEDFQNAAYEAERICPVSNALRNNLELRFNSHDFG